MLEVNAAFVNFSLKDQEGVARNLADYAGQWLVVYCYPKDNTSGCTVEAQDFSALAGQFAEAGAAVLGVSPDSVKSHAGFCAKKNLSITLLSDPERSFLEPAGVWQKKSMCGKEYMGVVRSTFLVDPEGRVREIWTKVKVPGHAQAVLEKLRKLRA